MAVPLGTQTTSLVSILTEQHTEVQHSIWKPFHGQDHACATSYPKVSWHIWLQASNSWKRKREKKLPKVLLEEQATLGAFFLIACPAKE